MWGHWKREGSLILSWLFISFVFISSVWNRYRFTGVLWRSKEMTSVRLLAHGGSWEKALSLCPLGGMLWCRVLPATTERNCLFQGLLLFRGCLLPAPDGLGTSRSIPHSNWRWRWRPCSSRAPYGATLVLHSACIIAQCLPLTLLVSFISWVSSGCQKISHIGCLRLQKFVSSQFLRLKL